MRSFLLNENIMIRRVGLAGNQNSNGLDSINIKNRFNYEYAGFFIIDNDNKLHCISKQLCDILGIDISYHYLSGEFLNKLILPGDAHHLTTQFLSYIKTLNRDIKVELRFNTLLGLKKVLIAEIKSLSNSMLLVDLQLVN